MKPVVDRLNTDLGTKADLYIYAEADKDQNAASFANQHGIQAVPTTVIVGADGKVERIFPKVKVDGHVANGLESL